MAAWSSCLWPVAVRGEELAVALSPRRTQQARTPGWPVSAKLCHAIFMTRSDSAFFTACRAALLYAHSPTPVTCSAALMRKTGAQFLHGPKFLKSMKNGTTAIGFPRPSERSRADVRHGTVELSDGLRRRAMADSLTTLAAALPPRRSGDGLPSRPHYYCARLPRGKRV